MSERNHIKRVDRILQSEFASRQTKGHQPQHLFAHQKDMILFSLSLQRKYSIAETWHMSNCRLRPQNLIWSCGPRQSNGPSWKYHTFHYLTTHKDAKSMLCLLLSEAGQRHLCILFPLKSYTCKFSKIKKSTISTKIWGASVKAICNDSPPPTHEWWIHGRRKFLSRREVDSSWKGKWIWNLIAAQPITWRHKYSLMNHKILTKKTGITIGNYWPVRTRHALEGAAHQILQYSAYSFGLVM
jgi:hypothetical protein